MLTAPGGSLPRAWAVLLTTAPPWLGGRPLALTITTGMAVILGSGITRVKRK